MTKKRFKFGLAILGVLGIFFMALLALVFAPNLASADKSTAIGHHQDGDSQSNHHNPAYYALYDGPQDGSGHHADNTPGGGNEDHCAQIHCEGWTDDNQAGGSHAQGANGEGGSNGGNGQSGNGSGGNSQGGQGDAHGQFAGGGFGGGGFGGGGSFTPGATGNAPDGCPDNKKNCDKNSGDQDSQGSDQSGSQGNGNQDSQGGNDSHGSDGDGSHGSDVTDNHQDGSHHDHSDDPSDGPSGKGNDPQSGPITFTVTDTTDTDPPGDNPPVTVLTDAPVQVPEPFTLSLFAVGLGGTALLRRRAKSTRPAA